MSGAVAEGEVVREARRVFRKLIQTRGAQLAPLPVANGADNPGKWCVRTPRARGAGITMSAAIVEAWLSRDWLVEEGPQRFILSPAGIAWYRRQTGGAEPFRHQHLDVVPDRSATAPHEQGRLLSTVGEGPLTWLRKRRDRSGQWILSSKQFEAGTKLERDFELAAMSARVTADWTVLSRDRSQRRAPRDSELAGSEVMAEARQRVRKALEAVGPELAGVLIEVCCLSHGLETAEERLNWPRRSGKLVLQLALTRLARHYGLLPAQPVDAGTSRRKSAQASGVSAPSRPSPLERRA